MKIVAYLRISTGGQELSNQRLAILDYAQHHQLQIDRFLEIQVSSRKSLKERGIDGLFAGMQAGDLLLVSELSRLGQALAKSFKLLMTSLNIKSNLSRSKENIHLDGKQDIQSKVMATMLVIC